jgi:hypothetical protein
MPYAEPILDQIETLQAQFGAILGGTAPRRGRKPGPQPKAETAEVPESLAPAKKKRHKKRKISPEARARIRNTAPLGREKNMGFPSCPYYSKLMG